MPVLCGACGDWQVLSQGMEHSDASGPLQSVVVLLGFRGTFGSWYRTIIQLLSFARGPFDKLRANGKAVKMKERCGGGKGCRLTQEFRGRITRRTF